MVPYTVAVNLIEVARLFVPEWNLMLEQRYGHTLQESWRTYQRNPSKYTVAWMDTAMTQSAAVLKGKVSAMVTPMLPPSSAAVAAGADCTNMVQEDADSKESP